MEILDELGQVVAVDLHTSVIATAPATTHLGPLLINNVAPCVDGECQFENMIMIGLEMNQTRRSEVLFSIYESNPPLIVHSTKVTVELSRLQYRNNRHALGIVVLLILGFLLLLNLGIATGCVQWLRQNRNKCIVKLAQPKFLVIFCVGCCIQNLSYVPYILGLTDRSCGFMIWSYTVGMALATSSVFTRLRMCERVVESALTHKQQVSPHMYFSAIIVMVGVGCGVLVVWELHDPVFVTRHCIKRRKGGMMLERPCVESVRGCRAGPFGTIYVGLLLAWLSMCQFATQLRCYAARNIPCLVSDASRIFCGLTGQLQLLVIGAPLLYVARNQPSAFALIHAVIISLSNISLLALLFIPRWQLVTRYTDFDSENISMYLQKILPLSTQDDHVFRMLAQSKNNFDTEMGSREGSISTTECASEYNYEPDSGSNRDLTGATARDEELKLEADAFPPPSQIVPSRGTGETSR